MQNRLVCGLSRKIGLPNFGSLGATCSLELEIEQREFTNAESLQANLRELFRQCDVAIAHELATKTELAVHQEGSFVAEQSSAGAQNQNGHGNIRVTAGGAQASTNSNGNSKAGDSGVVVNKVPANGSGNSGNSNGVKRVATQAQQRALHAIANKLSINLESELQNRLGIRYVSQISLRQASQLIDELKALQAGTGAVA